MGTIISLAFVLLQLLHGFTCHGHVQEKLRELPVCPTTVSASGRAIQPLNSALTAKILVGNITQNISESSPFERELDLHELLQPLATGTNRFSPHCSTVWIQFEIAEIAIKMVEYLMDEKIVRVNIDLFIFNGRNRVLRDLPNIPKFDYITFKHLGQYKDEQLGPFVASQGLIDSQLEMMSESSLVNGKHLNIKALNTPWFKVSHEDINKYSSGCYYVALKEASQLLNFSYTISEMTEGTGRKNGSKWVGAIGDLLYRRMDIVLTIAAAESRDSAIDGSDLLFWLRKVFWVRIYHEKQRSSSIIEPFSPLVWFTVLIALITFIAAFYGFMIAERNSGATKPKFWQLLKAIDAALRSLLEQEITFPIQSSRTRYVLFVWMIYTNVMLTGYRSKLFDVLSFSKEEIIPRTFQELAFVHSDYKIVYRSYGGVAEAQLERSTHPMHRAIQRSGRFKYLYTSAECMKAITIEKDERHGCIDFDVFGQFSIASNLSVTRGDVSRFFKESQDTDGRYIGVWAFRKLSGLTRIFNQKLARMLQGDLIGYWFREDLAARRTESTNYFKNSKSDGLQETMEKLADTLLPSVKPMPLKVFMISFIILAVGHIVCLVLLGLELAWPQERPNDTTKNVDDDSGTTEDSSQEVMSSALDDTVHPTILLSASMKLESINLT